jgi:hypothetical protein
LNVNGVKDVRHTEKHTAESLVTEPSVSDVELTFENLKRHKSPGIDQKPAELIKTGGRTIPCKIHKLISIWNEELPEWKKLIIVPPIRRAIKQIVVIIGAYRFCQQRTKFYPTSCCQG